MIHIDNKTVYESAKILRDKYVLNLDNGKTVYLDFFSSDIERNIYQVSHQITMDKDHKDDVEYKNRYDVTILINGLPLVHCELKRRGDIGQSMFGYESLTLSDNRATQSVPILGSVPCGPLTQVEEYIDLLIY